MEQTKATDVHPEVMRLFDRYVHGLIDRRGFIDRAAAVTGSAAAAAMALDLLRPDYSEAAQVVQPNDPRIRTQWIEYDSPGGAGKMRGLFAEPANRQGRVGGVLVVHENRGLNPHIQDVVRRFAVAGFVAFGPDALFPLGGWPGTDEAGVELQRKRNQEEMIVDFVNGARLLKARPEVNGKIGAVGFCFGGSVVNQLAVRLGADLAAAVPFYGGQPRAEDVPRIKAEVMIQYAENDERINAGAAAYEAALKANNVKYEQHFYPGTQHGFNNDTTPRFNKAQADIAMERTIALF
ncbi:MAG: dienelactone hydrolase family protein, partial [Vicinamibacterales bacterium]